MSTNEPTTNVSALTAKVTQSLANVKLLRAAMAQVSAQAKTTAPAKPEEEVK